MHVKALNVSRMHLVALSPHCEGPEASSTNVIHVVFDWMKIIRRIRQARERRTNPSISSGPVFALLYQRLDRRRRRGSEQPRKNKPCFLCRIPRESGLECGMIVIFCATGQLREGHSRPMVGDIPKLLESFHVKCLRLHGLP